MILLKLICILVAVKMGNTKISSRSQQGYPTGYLADCPGSNKEARITRSSLKLLKFVHINNRSFVTNLLNKTSYNYYQMEALAKRLDFRKKTVLYVNGYLDSNYITPMSPALAVIYKDLGYNFISLEYVTFTAMVYPKAARFLRPVGKHVAEMLVDLNKHGLDPKKMELIGISHGGQAISFIAKNYRQITNRNLTRLTAMDPSGPCFRNLGPEERIDASDADFVDIIHTNIDGYGMAAPVGHVDFYINGGEYQPGDFQILPCTSLCSHARSFTIWVAALLNPNTFIGMQCDTVQEARDFNCFDRKPFVTNIIGLNVDKSKHGIFYVMTGNSFPYGLAEKGLNRINDVFKKTMLKYNDADVMEL